MQVGLSGTDWAYGESQEHADNTMGAPLDVQVYIHAPSKVVAGQLKGLFEARGLRVYRSFDLQAALERLPRCGCPYHGQAACTCQYTVWLVYAPHDPPVLVILHGRDDKTWITLSADEVLASRAYDAVTELRRQFSASRERVS